MTVFIQFHANGLVLPVSAFLAKFWVFVAGKNRQGSRIFPRKAQLVPASQVPRPSSSCQSVAEEEQT